MTRASSGAIKSISRCLLCAGLALPACAGEPPVIQYEEHVTQEGEAERYIGGACVQLSEGDTSGTGTGGEMAPTYSILHEGLDDGVQVSVSGNNDGAPLAERTFSSDFLYSGKIDELTVALDNGWLRLVHWGGESCDPIRDPDVD